MEDARTALSSSRPGFSVGGQAQPALDAGLLRCVCADHEGGLKHLEAEFSNWGAQGDATGFTWFDRATLEFGRDLLVKIGSATVFEGVIMGLEARFPALAPPTVVVHAEDRLQDLRMARRTRVFENQSDVAIAQSIASEHGLTLQADGGGASFSVVTQINQSDLAFLRQRALLADADLWLDGRSLHLRQRAARPDSGLELVHGARLRQFEVLADLSHQRTALTCTGWSVGDKRAIQAQATDSAVAGETGAGSSGPGVLRQALGERKDSMAHGVPLDEGAARGMADAHMRALARRFLRGRGLADADARLQVGQSVKLSGLGPLFSGSYGVVETCHRFDASVGLRTEFVVERAWIGNP